MSSTLSSRNLQNGKFLRCFELRKSLRQNDNSKFFRLPAVKKHAGKVKQSLFKKRRDLWLSRLKRTDLLQDNHANLRVCSKHFISDTNISILFIYKCIIDLDRGKDWTYSFIFNGFVCSRATF